MSQGCPRLRRRKAQQLRVSLRGAGYEECGGAVPDEDQEQAAAAPGLVRDHVNLHIGPAGAQVGYSMRNYFSDSG